jgi:ParB family chromosome partitioning protein
MKVDINNIKIASRIRLQTIRIEELAADIKKNGLLNPITVMKNIDCKGSKNLSGEEYQLLAGLRRLRAAQSLGWTEIEVNIVTAADAEAALNIEYSENIQREQFTFSEKMKYSQLIEEIEKAKALERMAEGGKGGVKEGMDGRPYLTEGTSRDIIGGKVGMSGRQYDRAKYIAENASPDVIDQLDAGERSINKTYDELRTQEKMTPFTSHVIIPEVVPMRVSERNSAPPHDETYTKRLPGTLRRKRRGDPDSFLSARDKEAIQRLREYDALPPEGKIVELKRQLSEERTRAVKAESELSRLKELHHNLSYHSESIIDNLKRQLIDNQQELSEAYARIEELEGAKCNE